ncbi:MAG: class I SAM-dependent methyltransferase [Anaerolineaceae bacterium]
MPEWNELYKKEENRWVEPHERVVEAAETLPAGARILDLGCGAGRHLAYLAKQGFNVVGTDIAPRGLSYSRQKLEALGAPVCLTRSDMTAIPHADGVFDAVISIHVIFHNPLAGMRRTIAEIYRVLKPGGMAWITLQSKRSYRYGKGELLEPDTYLPDLGEDRDIPHHFSDLEELGRELRAFQIQKVLHDEHPSEDASGGMSCHWEVMVIKPGVNLD